MKIVFIGGRDIHQLGGIENYMYNLATQLVRLGHTPIVYCESDHNGSEFVNGFEVRYVKAPKNVLLCKPWASLKATLRSVLKEKDIDFIHYNAWPPSLWCWIPRVFGINSLMEGHGLEWQRSKYNKCEQRIMKAMERYTARLNRNLVMCSEDQVKYFWETYGRESVCVPGAVNLPSPDYVPASDVLERYGLVQGKYFLFIGRLVKDKNPDFLIKAFVKARLDGYKLVIAGANDAMPKYVNMLHSLAENSDVVFTGPVYGEDKVALFRGAFAFCLPSTIEGLSISIMEAMSFKLPIIATDIQANRELLGDNALFVQPEDEDGLASVLKSSLDFPKFEQFVNANYARVKDEYTWEKVAVRYVDYLNIIR